MAGNLADIFAAGGTDWFAPFAERFGQVPQGAPVGPPRAQPTSAGRGGTITGGPSSAASNAAPGGSGAVVGGAPATVAGAPGRGWSFGDPIDIGSVGRTALGAAGTIAGAFLPGAGIPGAILNGYNTWASDNIATKLGGGLSFMQALGGLFGLNDYSGAYDGSPMNLKDPTSFIPTPGYTPNPQQPSAYSRMTQGERDAHDRSMANQRADNVRNGGSATGPGTGAVY